MALYNALFEAASKLKKGTGAVANIAEGAAKSTRDAAQSMSVAAKQSEAWKAAGPALGKIAKFAAYPAGIGAGVGLGAWAAGAGASAAIDSTGQAVKQGWVPTSLADAGKMGVGLIFLVLFLVALVFLYKKVSKK